MVIYRAIDHPALVTNRRCNVCNIRLVYPFVAWRLGADDGAKALFFCLCHACCEGGIRQGLFTDMKRCSDISRAKKVTRFETLCR